MENESEQLVICASHGLGPVVAAYYVGILVSECSDGAVLVKEPAHLLQILTEQGAVLQWNPDQLFTFTEKPSKFMGLYRIADPIQDVGLIKNYRDFMQQLRLAKAGLVTGGSAAQKILRG